MEWKETDITQLCDTISVTYKGKSKNVVLINTSDVLDGVCLNHEKSPNSNLKGQFKKTFQKDDILYSEIRPANKRFAYIDFDPIDYIASTKLMVLRAKANVNPHFLYQILRSESVLEQLQILAESRSGTFPQITYSELANIKVNLPSPKEQDRIVAILSSLDRKIELNNKINAQLEEMAQAIFKNWLLECNEEIAINELSINVTDYTKCNNTEVVLVNSSDVTEGFFDHHNYSCNKDLKGHFKKRFKKGDILYSQVRPRNRHWAFCDFNADNYIASTQLMVIRNKPEIISSILLYQYIISDEVWKEFTLKTETRSGTFPQGNYEDLSAIKVPFGANMDSIDKTIESIYNKRYSLYRESLHLAQLRDTLLPKLMSGEITL